MKTTVEAVEYEGMLHKQKVQEQDEASRHAYLCAEADLNILALDLEAKSLMLRKRRDGTRLEGQQGKAKPRRSEQKATWQRYHNLSVERQALMEQVEFLRIQCAQDKMIEPEMLNLAEQRRGSGPLSFETHKPSSAMELWCRRGNAHPLDDDF